MGIGALKATPQYAAFRRFRKRLRERLLQLGRGLDAWTGAHRLQRTSLAALVAGDELQLLALAAIAEQLRRAEEERRAVSERLGALEQRVQAAAKGPAGSVDTPAGRVFETSTIALLEPELDLLAHLAPLLPSRVALDIGANAGEVSAALLRAGLQVHAFEPNPPVAQALRERFAAQPGFQVHAEALGAQDGEADLHLVEDRSPDGRYQDATVYASLRVHEMPDDLPFAGSVRVPVRRLETLHASGRLPPEIGLVKIDTEGLDVEVIRGMGEHRYPVVMAEFWDEAHVFARSGSGDRLRDLVQEMRRRGYSSHLVLFRVWGDGQCAYYCNLADSVEASWGNVLFFRDGKLFDEARRFCEATLPRALFRPHWPPRPRPTPVEP